ncbi:MAG: HNH endonuclease [Solirubrobacterales bacterium]|nr:HNH endonuclease [Solirubrobacterales bacterium]
MRVAALIDRDGPTCVWCGATPWPGDLSVEHLLPRSRRGRGLGENLVLACRSCNRRRASQPVVAHLRAERAAGREPGVDRLAAALARLSRSPSRRHAEYGRRQLAALEALPASGGPR